MINGEKDDNGASPCLSTLRESYSALYWRCANVRPGVLAHRSDIISDTGGQMKIMLSSFASLCTACTTACVRKWWCR